MVLPRHLPDIEYLIGRYDVALVVVDVLMAYLDGKVNSFKDQDVRQVLAQLSGMADRTGACVLFVRHLNKSGGPNPLYRGGGSIGIIGAARAGYVIARDRKEQAGHRRVLACVKSNLAPMPPAMAYKLDQDPARGVARVSWLGTTDDLAEDILRDDDADDDEKSERDQAAQWLRDYLTDAGGSALAGDAIKAGRAAGFTENAVKKARIRTRARTERQGFGPGARYTWTLPDGFPMHSMDTGSREQESKGNPWEATEPLFATDNDLERPDVLL